MDKKAVRLSSVAALSAISLLAMAGKATAAIVPVAYYHLGESDSPAAVAGATGDSTTADGSGNGFNLTRTGTPTYSSSVASSASADVGSSVSMNFGSSNTTNVYSYAAPVTTATNNFGIEGWFNLATPATQQVLALNGTGGNGYALYMGSGQLDVLAGGVTVAGTGFDPAANTWFYAAFVDNNGTTTAYVNNTTPITVGTFGYETPSSTFTIGGQVNLSNPMSGLADDVRVFTFTAGQFSTSDLLISQTAPEPSTIGLLALGAAAALLRRRSRRSNA